MKTLLFRHSMLLALLMCAPVLATARGLRDPTRPLAATDRGSNAVSNAHPAASIEPPQLQLVLLGHDRRYAVIDGELLAEGDAIRGLALLRILDDAVVLKTPNGPRTLPLSVPVEQ